MESTRHTQCRHCTRQPSSLQRKQQRLQSPQSRNGRQQGFQMVRSTAQADAPARTKLGRSELEVSRLGVGTLQWGDTSTGFGERYSADDLAAAFDAAVAGGVNYFDTAEVYGYQGIKTGQQSEQLLSRIVKQSGKSVVVGTKYFTIPWTNFLIGGGFRLGRQSMMDALKASLQRMDTDSVDLWQVHFPFPTYSQQVLSEGLQEAYEQGLTRAVGVCNYNTEQVERMHSLLDAHGIPLASNQVRYSVLDRAAETSGLLQSCQQLGVSLVAHSPLEQGLLTGKYVEEGGGRKAEKVRPLLKVMQFIGTLLGGKTVTQVALNYLMQKGAIPIPGGKNAAQVTELAETLRFDLDENEVAIIDEKLAALRL